MIRVLVADDEPLVRAGIRMLAQAGGDIEVCGEAGDGAEAVRLAEHLVPDVVLMDLRMPRMDGVTAIRRILGHRPGARIVVLTTFSADADVDAALRAGATGFLVKDDEPERIVDGIRRAAAGEPILAPAVLRRVVARALDATAPGAAEGAADRLTAREREVLGLVGTGASNAEIAAALHIGVTTVKTHLSAAMDKLGLRNRSQAAVAAHRLGLVPPAPPVPPGSSRG